MAHMDNLALRTMLSVTNTQCHSIYSMECKLQCAVSFMFNMSLHRNNTQQHTHTTTTQRQPFHRYPNYKPSHPPNPASQSSHPSHHQLSNHPIPFLFVFSSRIFSSHPITRLMQASPFSIPSHPKPLTMPLSTHAPFSIIIPIQKHILPSSPRQDTFPHTSLLDYTSPPPPSLSSSENSAALPLVWCHVSLQRRNSSSRVPVASAECLRNLLNRLSSHTLFS